MRISDTGTFALIMSIFLFSSWKTAPYNFTQYTSKDGLHQKTITCILEGSNGKLWFSSWNGIYSYDGYE